MSGVDGSTEHEFPVCWEDPETLRIGFDRAEFRLHHPTAGAQRLLSSLHRRTPAQFARAAREAGLTHDERETLSALLAPAETVALPGHGARPCESRSPRVGVLGEGETARIMCAVFSSMGCEALPLPRGLASETEDWFVDDRRAPDLVIIAERFLQPLIPITRYASARVPHLIVRFTDRSIRIGPLIDSTPGPCAQCVVCADLDTDPALHVLAAQLDGSRPATETATAAAVAGAFAATQVQRWWAGDAETRSTRLLLRVKHGVPHAVADSEVLVPHPRCACRALTVSGLAA